MYYKGISVFFYVDLADVSLDDNTVVEPSKWIDLTNIKPKPDGFQFFDSTILVGKNKDKIIFFETSIDIIKVIIFDTTLKKWEINKDVVGKLKGSLSSSAGWISDEKTGLAYLFDSDNDGIVIFDSVNLKFLNISVSNPKSLFNDEYVTYNDYAQVLLLSYRQILYIGGWIRSKNNKQPMSNILTYNIITDTWQMMV